MIIDQNSDSLGFDSEVDWLISLQFNVIDFGIWYPVKYKNWMILRPRPWTFLTNFVGLKFKHIRNRHVGFGTKTQNCFGQNLWTQNWFSYTKMRILVKYCTVARPYRNATRKAGLGWPNFFENMEYLISETKLLRAKRSSICDHYPMVPASSNYFS